MEQVLAVALFVFGILLCCLMAWLERLPKKEFAVSVIPTTPLMFTGALLAIIAIAYLLNIYGIMLPERGRF